MLASCLTAGSLTAGEVGKPLIISAGGTYSMTGASVVVRVSPGNSTPGAVLQPSFALTGSTVVNAGGLTVTYTTVAGDFAIGGIWWNIQLVVTNPPAAPFISGPGYFYVYPAI